jgi:oxygen-independent coproporphyrinogen-3 oxidase
MDGEVVERTVQAIINEVLRTPLKGIKAKTIFFGGGTPTFLEASQLERLLDAVRTVHPPTDDCEITSEANPGTVDASKFKAMRQAGFNRVSLGAQSFLDTDLLKLDRVHKAGEIGRAVESAREAGFENLNLDLMFALPDQSRFAWNQNLDRALSLQPEHLSLYCLTIEQNTAFYKKHLRNELNLPDDDSQRQMYEDCLNRMRDSGYAQYEISNFSKPGFECQHNLCYWRGEVYAGYGPGAVGCIPSSAYHGTGDENSMTRYTNLKHPERYCAAVENSEKLPFEHEDLSPQTQMIERIMLGLRLNQGVSEPGMNEASIQKLIDRGWIEQDFETIRLTEEGRHFCSEVALELIPF